MNIKQYIRSGTFNHPKPAMIIPQLSCDSELEEDQDMDDKRFNLSIKGLTVTTKEDRFTKNPSSLVMRMKRRTKKKYSGFNPSIAKLCDNDLSYYFKKVDEKTIGDERKISKFLDSTGIFQVRWGIALKEL